MNSRGHPLWTSISSSPMKNWPCCGTWETMKTLPPANTCAAPPAPSLQSLLQRAKPLTLRSPHRRLPIAFPAPLHPGGGGPRRAAHRRADHYRAGFAPSARLATRRKGRALHRRRGVRGIQPLLGGLIVAGLPDSLPREIHLADTFASRISPPGHDRHPRQARGCQSTLP